MIATLPARRGARGLDRSFPSSRKLCGGGVTGRALMLIDGALRPVSCRRCGSSLIHQSNRNSYADSRCLTMPRRSSSRAAPVRRGASERSGARRRYLRPSCLADVRRVDNRFLIWSCRTVPAHMSFVMIWTARIVSSGANCARRSPQPAIDRDRLLRARRDQRST